MREEYELEVLEKYDIEVKSTRRIRGAFFCIGSELKSGRVGDFGDCLQSRSVPFGAAGDYDTKERPMLLKETKLSERRALFLYDALSEIERCGNVKVDTPVFTKEGELRAASREGAFYMLKNGIREESATFVRNRTLYGRRQNLPFCIKIWKNWL